MYPSRSAKICLSPSQSAASFYVILYTFFLQVECNPNIFPDPFKAQVFFRVWDDKFEVSSQAMLTKLTDSIKLHAAAIKAQA